MKHKFVYFFLTMLMSMVVLNASAHDIEVKNADGVTIYYKYINDNKELGVTYEGVSLSYNTYTYTGNVVIPSTVNYGGKNYKVTSIMYGAFFDCNKLTSVSIPNTITSIEGSAFFGCSMMENFTIPNSVVSIGSSAFMGTAWYDNQPDGLVYAGKVAYKYKGEMSLNKTIEIKNGTLGIAARAFSHCTRLISITIPNSVSTIGDSAFDDCTGLSSVYNSKTTPQTVSSNTFNKVYDIATLYVPKGAKLIYNNFPNWKKFKNIEEFDPSEMWNKEVNISLSSAGYATFFNAHDNFKIPTELSAQVITASNSGKLKYNTIVNGIIPKGVPVILVSNSRRGGTYTLTSTTESASYSGENLMHGSSLMTMTSNVNGVSTSGNSSYVYYKLAYGKSGSVNANKLGWYWGANNGAAFTIAGGKAWLALPKSSAQSLDAILLEEDDATSIDGIEQSYMNEANDAQYNMAGQRVGNGYNGIIIVNGKKVIR